MYFHYAKYLLVSSGAKHITHIATNLSFVLSTVKLLAKVLRQNIQKSIMALKFNNITIYLVNIFLQRVSHINTKVNQQR